MVSDNTQDARKGITVMSEPQNNYYQQNSTPVIPPEYQPISMWGYFGYEILFSIPIAGIIIALVFAFTAKNKNVKNFARSYFCFLIIVAVLVAVIFMSVGTALSSY